MSDDEDSLDGRGGAFTADEISDIKRAKNLASERAARLANARSFAVLQQAKGPRTAPSSSSSSTAWQHKNMHEAAGADYHRQQEDVNLARQSAIQFEEAKRLRHALEEREREVKECRFEIKQMQGRLVTLQTSEKAYDTKFAAATSQLKESCDAAERALENRKRLVQSECDRLIRLVSGIERHTMHGHHAVASRTTGGLLLKTRHGLENLKRCVVEDGESAAGAAANGNLAGTSSSSGGDSNVRRSHQGAAQYSASGPGGSQHYGQVKADALDGALLDMCKHLEEENTRLESALAVTHADLEETQRESSATKLIPHYRLAIVRARAQASTFAEQLQREQVCLATLPAM